MLFIVSRLRPYVRSTHGAASGKPGKGQNENRKMESKVKDDNGGDDKKEPDIWDMDRVCKNSMDERKSQEDLERMAQWVTSWMLPWERDQMDGRRRELVKWEEYYWVGFLTFGVAGLSWEVYVAQNSRLFKKVPKEHPK